MADIPFLPTEQLNEAQKQLGQGNEWLRPELSSIPWKPADELHRRAAIAIAMNHHSESKCFYLHRVGKDRYGEVPGMHNYTFTWSEAEVYKRDDGLIGHGSADEPTRVQWITDCNETRHPVDGKRVKKLRLIQLCVIPTLHTWGYYGFFKPTIAEVLSQIPTKYFDLFPRMYYYTDIAGPLSASLIGNYHIGKTAIFVPARENEYVYLE